jgi:MFS family permease
MAVAVAGMLEVALFALTDTGLHRPPTFIGVLGTIQGLGSIAGGLGAAPLMRRWGETPVIAGGLIGLGASLGLLAVATLTVVVVALLLIGASLAATMVGYMTLLQRRTSNELQGRVFSAAEAIITVPYTLSMGLGAVLIAVISFRWIYGANAMGMILAGVWLARGARTTPDEGGPASVGRIDLSAGTVALTEELVQPPGG